MIKTASGNIFESDAQCIVNPVNCVGVMGKGLALQFKRRYPAMFINYQGKCSRHLVRIGQPYLFQCKDKIIMNFPTKLHWRDPSEISYIEQGLRYVHDHYKRWGIRSIAFPRIGCGCGGLDWNTDIRPLMYKYLEELDGLTVYLYER